MSKYLLAHHLIVVCLFVSFSCPSFFRVQDDADELSSLENPASDAVEMAVGVAAFHDKGALAAFRTTLERLVKFLDVMEAPIDTVMSFQQPWTQLEGYVGQTDRESLLSIVQDGNIRELGAAIYVATDLRHLQSVFLFTLCRLTAKDIGSCDAGRYSEITVDGTRKVELRTPGSIPGDERIPDTTASSFRECPLEEQTEDGFPLGLCITKKCLEAGKCPCHFPESSSNSAREERLRIYAGMGGKDNIGFPVLMARYREVCKTMPEQYTNPFITMLYKYTLYRPSAGYLATARVGDKVKSLPGVPDEDLQAMQARHKSGLKDIKTRWTKTELDSLGVGLSEREWAYQKAFVPRNENDRLDWNIGAFAWRANYDGKTSKVVGSVTHRQNYANSRKNLGLRVFNSPSGTTDQTLQTGLFMGLKSGSPALYNLRLGCIGYMLWAEHHSYDEMGVAGLPYRLKYDSQDPFNFTTLLGNAQRGAEFLEHVEAEMKHLVSSSAKIGGETMGHYDFSGAEAYFNAHATA